jgi:hypothetical protein
MRLSPPRYATAVMRMAYETLISFGVIFTSAGIGRSAGIVTGPKRNDWVDGTIASASAHARVLLSAIWSAAKTRAASGLFAARHATGTPTARQTLRTALSDV